MIYVMGISRCPSGVILEVLWCKLRILLAITKVKVSHQGVHNSYAGMMS
jgi:hypothetical protein